MEIRKEVTFLVVLKNAMIKIAFHSRTFNMAVVFRSRVPEHF